jgi:hypothetical protein
MWMMILLCNEHICCCAAAGQPFVTETGFGTESGKQLTITVLFISSSSYKLHFQFLYIILTTVAKKIKNGIYMHSDSSLSLDRVINDSKMSAIQAGDCQGRCYD